MPDAASALDDIAGEDDFEAELEKGAEGLDDTDSKKTPDEGADEETPKDEGEDGDKEGEEGRKTVPLTALHEERDRAREARQEANELRERVAKMEALWERIQKQEAKPEETGPEIPDYDQDPEGYYKGTIEHLQKQVEQLSGKFGEKEQQEQSTAQERQLMEQYAASVRTYSAEVPDFQDAYNHVAKAIDEDLKARGYDDPKERASVIQYEEGMLVGRALRQGKNPAELIYNYAKSRGYTPKADEEDKLERLEKGQKAAKSLSGAGGKSEGNLTLEKLASLADEDPEEFDRQWEAARKKGLLG